MIAIIPVKELRRSKERLASVLTQKEREGLTIWMLNHLLEVLKRTSIDQVIISSPDEKILKIARENGFIGIKTDKDLNGAVEEGLHHASRMRADAALVLPADIPMVSPKDIEGVLKMDLKRPFVVLSPSHDGGTNAILVSLPTDFRPLFGESSFEKHLRQGKKYNLYIFQNERLSFDIDNPEDLERFRRMKIRSPI